MQVMCRASIHYESFYKETGIRFREFFANELDHLQPMEADGLLLMLDDRLAITDLGRLFIRNIAMVFDQYLAKKKSARPFSKTV